MGHGLNIHPSGRRDHELRQERQGVQRDPGIKFPGNGETLFNEEFFHPFAADRKRQQGLRFPDQRIPIRGKTDATGLAAATPEHLALEDDRIAQLRSNRGRFRRAGNHIALRDRNAGLG